MRDTRSRPSGHATELRGWFDPLTGRRIRPGSHTSTRALADVIRLYLSANHEHPKPAVWLQAADGILATIARLCTRTLAAGS